MLYLGCHLSASGGYAAMCCTARSICANTFQFFTRNPRGGNAKATDEKDIKKLADIMKEYEFGPLLAHAPYTMNLCSDKEDIRTFARGVLKEDIDRMKYLPDARFLFHPGSHVGQGAERGIEFIVDALNEAVTDDDGPLVLLEGMSGKGSEIGRTFEELAQIIQGVKHNKRMGIVIDTCHMHSAGYDIVNDLDGVLDEIDRVVGLESGEARRPITAQEHRRFGVVQCAGTPRNKYIQMIATRRTHRKTDRSGCTIPIQLGD